MTPTAKEIWHTLDLPLIAILRGIKTDETESIVNVLLEEGFRAIEIPLNSPDPFESIGRAVKAAQGVRDTLIGAGTVLEVSQVARVQSQGGNLIVSPNLNRSVVEQALTLGMASFPGVFSPTEAHCAVELGATGLKLFPADLLGPAGIAAIAATLPTQTSMVAVGGVGSESVSAYLKAGVKGFGLGSSLYRPGDTAEEVRAKASALVKSYRKETSIT